MTQKTQMMKKPSSSENSREAPANIKGSYLSNASTVEELDTSPLNALILRQMTVTKKTLNNPRRKRRS